MARTNPGSRPPTQRPPPRGFRPRFSIGILYLVVFFFLFAILQVLPDLIGLLNLPPGAEQEEAARELAQERSNPLVSLLLSLVVTCLGAYYKLLPGLGEG